MSSSASAASSSTGTASAPSLQTETASDDQTPAIIGGAVGASVGLVVLIGIAVVLYQRRARPPPNEVAMRSQNAVAPPNEIAMPSQSAVVVAPRQQYGPSPVLAPTEYGPGPPVAPGSAYVASMTEFQHAVSARSTYGVFADLDQQGVVLQP
jgi:hypothetical protein